jgi:hypothetical protein
MDIERAKSALRARLYDWSCEESQRESASDFARVRASQTHAVEPHGICVES